MHANGETTMKLQVRVAIAMITLIAVLASAGCLEPAGTAVNATPEPTQEPCETCTVPEGFCGPPAVCPGEPVNGVYVFTDKNTYRIGEVVEFGIVNCGDERILFAHPSPWLIERWVTNASGGMPRNNTSGTWEIIGDAGSTPCAGRYLNPGQNWTVQWNTTDWNTPEWNAAIWSWNTAEWNSTEISTKLERWRVHPVDDNVTLTPGKYRIWYGRDLTKEFKFV
mgnify:CR=1 FL=1